ncbi:glycosyltransferase family 4 protein [aff. Roholtiella sp. LEGE 12411]|uniref:glycosyltransferase family 4 protein n=1 Tax=aff. Roholtiella sp. LEGE 12411 TaxID=1828822 RepID=UPI001882C217|nr:glycosyltransferase family 4 protein [aff. Roholtiella sp. LEGE 12411]MBE9035243.1 glycosyltransferase family 4 protein [aff. Roholtiella sp. LEGE 12411]
MQIAIIAPSPVPFCIGGAENLWWGLLKSINQNTHHQAELIKLPSPERNFWELIDSYKSFSELDLTHFDLVISGKYPGWMVQHPNHICYMLHRLRGLYDTYHFTKYPEIYSSKNQDITALQKFIRSNQGNRNALKEFFERLERLRSNSNCPKDAFQFPGPLIREFVHFLDGIGLASNAINKYAAIAQNVVKRQNYFPLESSVEVIYPPSNIESFRRGNSDYLFTVGRLDSAKRISLLIQAMKYVKTNIQLKIAGTGPDADYLKQLAGEDERIVFLGFVNDQEITNIYADSLAVSYVPYDEDYGLVTIEAMMSGKPVLTTTDAGGPNEFVINSETGYSVPPEPQALAERIDYLCEHRDEAQQMGLTGRKLVAGINWENTVARLLGDKPTTYNSPSIKKRQKITVALTFPVFPPRGGGQSRVFHLYRQIASQFDVELVTFTNADQEAFQGEIAPNLYETRIPKSQQHQEQEWLIEKKVGVPITDVIMPQLYHLTPAYMAALKASVESSDFVVACHPYLLPAIQAVTNKAIWYEAQDVEVELKKGILPNNPIGHELLEITRKIEDECCRLSELIMVCSMDDAKTLHQIYGTDISKILEVPNGVDLETVNYVDIEKRYLNKQKLGLSGSFTAIFMGSWHSPNLEAVWHIFKMAQELPDVNFLVIGSVGLAFRDEPRPANVGFMGAVDEETKNTAFELADVALNPVTFGSGTNLKMLEYFASGIPVISTPTGARGLGIEDGKHCTVVQLENFPEAIANIKYEDLLAREMRVEAAKRLVQEKFDWQAIANNFIHDITCKCFNSKD